MTVPFPLTTEPESFIGAWFISDLKLCDDLIEYFKNSTDKSPGYVNNGSESLILPDIKDSEDSAFTSNSKEDVFVRYLINLQDIADEYKKKYTYCDEQVAWSIIDDTNIQYYKPGSGYKAWHTERNRAEQPSGSRHLVFMTYLNDVTDQGETEFFYQKIKVKPVKGLTLVWPADWTHTHRGIPSPTEEKYIITGWFNFLL